MTKNTLYLIFALFLLGAVLYYFDSPETLLGDSGNLGEKPKVFPYAVANNAATRYYSTEGVLDYTFNAERLELYREEIKEGEHQGEFVEYTLINEPRLVIFLPEKSWYIESRSGKISDQGKVITLWDDVKVWQEDDTNKNTQLSTEQLKIMPHEKFAETTEPVKILSKHGQLNATGMEVSFINKKIKLLSKVRAQHDSF